MSKGREITSWSEREFVRNRYSIWFGADSPRTIAAKELIDNAIDQISDNKCNKVHIRVGEDFIEVMDSGAGIATKKDPKTGKTHLFLAVGKLYTSSNYDGSEGLVGTNGVGSSASNFLSKEFKAGYVKNNKFTGYLFEEGQHRDEGETLDIIENFEAPLESGFYVYSMYDDKILEDPIKIDWLLDYTSKRVGELKEGSIVIVKVENNIDNPTYTYDKIKGSEHYQKSWLEQVQEVEGCQLVKTKGWTYALAKEKGAFNHISAMVQGAPVDCSKNFNAFFEIEGYNVKVPVPYSMHYIGKRSPKYTDQTKRRIMVLAANMMEVLKKNSSLYNYHYKEAERAYLEHMLKNNDSDMYWPAIGSGYKELIIAEGHSAIKAIKAQRDPKTQACLALRGKILNVYNKPLKIAMRSPIVKEVLTILSKEKFDKIIICCDADDHGSHITTLLLGLFATYMEKKLIEGDIYYCHTPFYVFEKGSQIKWSDSQHDCPKGWRLSVNKGLGSLTPTQVKMFITNPETRDLWRMEYDQPLAQEKLYFSLVECGKRWIHDFDLLDIPDNK